MLDVETTLDMSVLEGLDFTPNCQHSMHEIDTGWHDDGGAKWIFSYTGACGMHVTLPICDKWARTVPTFVSWRCRQCGREHAAAEVEWTITPLVSPE